MKLNTENAIKFYVIQKQDVENHQYLYLSSIDVQRTGTAMFVFEEFKYAQSFTKDELNSVLIKISNNYFPEPIPEYLSVIELTKSAKCMPIAKYNLNNLNNTSSSKK